MRIVALRAFSVFFFHNTQSHAIIFSSQKTAILVGLVGGFKNTERQYEHISIINCDLTSCLFHTSAPLGLTDTLDAL